MSNYFLFSLKLNKHYYSEIKSNVFPKCLAKLFFFSKTNVKLVKNKVVNNKHSKQKRQFFKQATKFTLCRALIKH